MKEMDLEEKEFVQAAIVTAEKNFLYGPEGILFSGSYDETSKNTLEFSPQTDDKTTSEAQGVHICTVKRKGHVELF